MKMKIPKLKVQLRGGFSDRNGIKPENTKMQTTSLDARTRSALVSAMNLVCRSRFRDGDNYFAQDFIKLILSNVYAAEVNWTGAYPFGEVLELMLETIRSDDYDSVLTLIEYAIKELGRVNWGFSFDNRKYNAASYFNHIFEQEYVGYRYVGDRITKITDPIEINTIEEAMTTRYREVNQHIHKANGFLANRDTPDYANSIKESISAVERMCSIVVGQATTLGDALKKCESTGFTIHPALKSAFEKLYGYTSDSSGIRHAGQLGGKEATFEEAKFMMASCCAFVNYLTGVLAKNEK